MIVAPYGQDHLALINQIDHARLSAELLKLWCREAPGYRSLPDFPWRDELLFATREHDNGWAEIDSAPMVNEQGQPHDFISIPTTVRQELWNRGTRKHVSDHPLAALWITRHALHLHRAHQDQAEWQPAMDTWQNLEAELAAEGAWPADALDAGYRWLNLADSISLAACARRDQTVEEHGLRIQPHPEEPGSSVYSTVFLDPLPLAGSTLFRVNARILKKRRFTGDADLAVSLMATRWTQLEIRVRASSPRS